MTEELIKILQDYVEADEINRDSDMKHDLGVASFDTVCIVDDIKKKFGVKLETSDFVKYKTVGEMADYIESLKK